MTISERIFELIKQRGYTQKEFSVRTGIAESTISDWKKKGTNPVSDKILTICKVLEVSPYFLLSGSEDPGTVTKPVAKKPAAKKPESITVKEPAAVPVSADKPKADKKTADKMPEEKKAEEKKPVAKKPEGKRPDEKKDIIILPEIATISSDDDDYHIRPADDDAEKDKKKDKKNKKKDKEKDVLKEKKKDKKEKSKDKKDKKKKKKGYLITY